jgi:hypothetical protein
MSSYFKDALATLSDAQLEDLAGEVLREQSARNVALLDERPTRPQPEHTAPYAECEACKQRGGEHLPPKPVQRRAWAIPMGPQVGHPNVKGGQNG